jgi:thiamine biosynthesis protein ThiS
LRITLNGESQEIPDGLSIAALLVHLRIRPERVAIERNLGVLPRAKWGETQVAPGDSLEIVQFVGGG